MILLLLVAAVSCASPSAPSPPPTIPPAPALMCPADIATSVVDASSTPVDYDPPVATGGTAPVSTTCTVPSGTNFPLGTTAVTCTARDASARTAQCSFEVVVALTPVLNGATVVAFGDSITEGDISPPILPATMVFDPTMSYPTYLDELLRERYSSQTIAVINAGVGGEAVTKAGEGRIERLALEYQPDVLMVLEGVNDLNGGADPEDVSEALRRGVRRARQQGVPLILVSTVLPGVEGRPKAPDPDLVLAVNEEIRAWVAIEGAELVDGYALFDPMKELYIGQDGLHPTPEGNRALAGAFFKTIRDRLEQSPPAVSGAVLPVGRRW